ncbi:hypothetical protein M0D69_06030 [Caballeronia sp. SEWSISQ10-4 2]|uniref:hypothetical protein n=1 Tax=Caballeronia sp. SEWSISQ10-4 2 TaxID=2937438 RepID=UPI002653BD81|nr:hypothetical protein [Caballeronia sp. SEWSISQ10-4 2]MDN7177584.1 hypothetical protein [Caballeronia sp. SEWSISQ10-4 2]
MIRAFSRTLTRVVPQNSPRTLFKSTATATAVLFAAAALLACTPAYDWRTIQNNDDAYEVTFPAKPRSDARDIDIAGKPMHMKMQMAEAGDAVFAVGTVDLPDADPATQRAALDFLQQGLARNLNTVPAAHPVQIDVAAGGHLVGAEIAMSGTSGDGPKSETRQIRARFIAKGTHAYQVAIVSTKAPPPDQIDQFFSSFKLF